jgi:hypothetical protein
MASHTWIDRRAGLRERRITLPPWQGWFLREAATDFLATLQALNAYSGR